ncbi:MAG: serine hydrolase domain-containing protein [Geminicoccaceae bacterium]
MRPEAALHRLWRGSVRGSAGRRHGAGAGGGMRPRGSAAELDRAIRRGMQELAIPGVAVAIVHRGQEHVRSYGVADVRTGRPVTARTNFRIASNSKTFTGTAAMRLVDEGRLDLDLPVRRYVTDFRPPAGAEGVTVRQVLNHSAGWLGYDYHDTGSDDQALARYVRDVRRLPQLTPVGRTFSYSNAALSVAGRVVETVTGTPFEAAVHRLVLAPLGMTGSGYDTRRVADQATPHAVVDGRAVAPIRASVPARQPVRRSPLQLPHAELCASISATAGRRTGSG